MPQVEIFRGTEWNVTVKDDVCTFRTFSTVRASQYMCPSGHAAYYELEVIHLLQAPQFGFCTEAFEGTTKRLDNGVGDTDSSWGVDGHRNLTWHCTSKPWGGRRWKEGDVIGLACQLSKHSLEGGSIWVSLNGDFLPPYGLVFSLPSDIAGLFAAFTASNGVTRCNLGEKDFKYAPPSEVFKPMCSYPSQ